MKRILPNKDMAFWRGKGCAQCLGSGYAGRVGINEVLDMTTSLRRQVLARAGELTLKAEARKEGMATMREDALIKASKGLTTLEEVVRVTAQDEN